MTAVISSTPSSTTSRPGAGRSPQGSDVSNACRDAGYLTGQIIRVDGGGSVSAA